MLDLLFETIMHRSLTPRPWSSLVRFILGSVIVLSCKFTSTGAAEFRQAETIEVAADEVVAGDLFVTANTARIEGTVKGDLYVLANQAVLLGEVQGSTHVLAQTIELSGTFTGSVRSASETLSVMENSILHRDLMAAGRAISTLPGSQINGDLYAASSELTLGGTVAGKANLAADTLALVGRFDSDVSILTASPGGSNTDSGLTWGEGTRIGGNLTIQANVEPVIPATVSVAGETLLVPFETAPPVKEEPLRAYLRLALLIWGQLLLVGLGFRIVLPGRTRRYLNNLHRLPFLAALLGPCYWLLIWLGGALAIAATVTLSAGLSFLELWDVMPLVFFIGFVAVVTLWGGGTLLGFILGPVLTGVWFCRTLLGWLPGFGREAFLVPAILGTAGIAAATAIPQYGFIVWLVTASFGSGAYLTRAESEPPPAQRFTGSAPPIKNRIT
jgi:cytoskeletal protein CcmA (bactofilin family)